MIKLIYVCVMIFINGVQLIVFHLIVLAKMDANMVRDVFRTKWIAQQNLYVFVHHMLLWLTVSI